MKEETKKELDFWLRMHKRSVQPSLMMLFAGFFPSMCWAFGWLTWGTFAGKTGKQFTDEGWYVITLLGSLVVMLIPLAIFLITMHIWEKKSRGDGKSE